MIYVDVRRPSDRGFKFGIYTSAGNTTCAHKAGSRNNYKLDAQSFADWGVDYIKFDWYVMVWLTWLEPLRDGREEGREGGQLFRSHPSNLTINLSTF